MSYSKHTWQTGELVSSQWLNHMEEGINDIDNTEIPELTRGLKGAKVTLTLSDNGRFKINRYVSSGYRTQLIWKGYIYITSADGSYGRKSIAASLATANQINSDSGYNYASYNETTGEITITITTDKEIVFKYSESPINAAANKIKVQERTAREITDICLLGAYYADIYGLALENYLIKQLWDNGGNTNAIPELTRGLIGAKASIMISDNGRFKINRYTGSGGTIYTQLIWTGNITLESTGGRKTIRAQDVITAVGNSYATRVYDSTTDKYTATITITTNKEIVYKYSTNTLAIQYRDTVPPDQQQWSTYDPNLQQGRDIDDICLLGTYYQDIYGLAFENHLIKQLWDGQLTRGLIGAKASIMISDNGRFKIDTDVRSGTNYRKLIWTGNITLESTGGRKTISAEQAATDIGSTYATYNRPTNTVTIEITTNKEIVYKYSTNKMAIQYRDTGMDTSWSTYDPNLQQGRDIDDICLLGTYYADVYGLALENCLEKQMWDMPPQKGITSNKATVFLSDNAKFSFFLETILTGSGAIDNWNKQISWSNWLYININNGVLDNTRITLMPGPRTDYPNNPDVKTQLVADQASNQVSYNSSTKKVTVTVAHNHEIVYNISTNSLHYQWIEGRKIDDIVLIGSYYQTTYGLIWDEMNRRAVQDSLNSAPYTGLFTNWETPLKRYHALFRGKNDIESFAFYTDSHVMGFSDSGYYEHYYTQYVKQVQKIYNSSACNFIMNGGDWLNSHTSHNEALHRLGMIKGFTKSMMRNHHFLVGNHDTNYHGAIVDEGTANEILPTLTHDEMNNIWFGEENTHKSYYSFDGKSTKFYCFDTWDLEQTSMGDYENEQATWFANSLLTDNPERVVCFLHGFYVDNPFEPNARPINVFANKLTEIANAFNNNSSINVDGVTYSFSSSTGKVFFFISGHTHQNRGPTTGASRTYLNHSDAYYMVNRIPCLALTTRGFRTELAIVGLFLLEYDDVNRICKLNITQADANNINGNNDSESYGCDREFTYSYDFYTNPTNP